MKKLILILLTILIIKFSFAQTQITNFIYKEGDESSFPSDFLEFNGLLFFGATNESFGQEIWVSNGNKDGASLLKDINLGKGNGITNFQNASVVLNNTLYFIGNDGSSNGELWKTDGTSEGTEKITHSLNYSVSNLTLAGDRFYFLTKSSDTLQVWISDGTEMGTKIVLGDIPIWNSPTFQGALNNLFIFTFQPYGTNKSKVWRSDGTPTGTFPITNEIDGNGAGEGGTSSLTQYIILNNELYFVSRHYLFKTDGTVENTKIITTLYDASVQSIQYADVIENNGKLYFSFFDVYNKRICIWKSDGTALGTNKIYDQIGSRYYMPSNLSGNSDNLIFCGPNQTGGTSLIGLNLTDYSTRLIIELQDTAAVPFIFTKYKDLCIIQQISNGKYFISSPTLKTNKKGWISDLTENSTTNITSLNNILSVFKYNGSLYFSKNAGNEGAELWKSDGTESGTLLQDNINKSKYGLTTTELIPLNSNLIYNTYSRTIGTELWIYSNGNANQFKDIQAGTASSYPYNFTKFNNELYFVSNDDMHGNELWKTNGTIAGTEIAFDILEGINSSYPSFLKVCKDALFFTASKNGHNYLCKTKGSTLEFVKDLGVNSYNYPYTIISIASSGDYLYFVTDGSGKDLWISNGTESGTYKLKDFYNCGNLTDVNGKLFFTATESRYGHNELWITDGTVVGTSLVKDLGYSSSPKELINYNNMLVFTAFTSENGRELWKSDGTKDGTFQITDIYPGFQSSIVNANFCILGNDLYFNANNGINGFELWKTNGSELSTTMLKDINIGIDGSFPSQLVSINNLIYFQAYDFAHGSELWKSDGTRDGTVLVADIVQGFQSSTPTNILAISNDVYFIAEAPNNGRQIWKIDYNTVQDVSNIIQDDSFSIYPNPCKDFIYIKTDNNINEIKIFNYQGQLVATKHMSNNSINISNLTHGLYILECKINGKEVVRSIIKE